MRAMVMGALALAIGACSEEPQVSTMERTGEHEVGFDAGADASMACGTAVLESFEISGAYHVDDPVYDDPPPVGGDHRGCWVDYGVYEEAVHPGNWVHNLEHGAVVLLYDCDDCDADVAALRQVAETRERIVMTPYGGLPTRFAAVAWGHRITMDCLDVAIVEAFYDDYFDMAPESVPSGNPDGC